MRTTLLLSFIFIFIMWLPASPRTPQLPAMWLPASAGGVRAQTQPAAPRATTKPAGRSSIVVTVTDPRGATLPGVRVESIGTSDRGGETDASGTVRLEHIRAGTYRLRLSGSGVIAFEREVVVRAGQTADVDVTLYPAPEVKNEAPAPSPAPAGGGPPVGPRGEPKTVSILDLLDKEFVGKLPRRETVLGCSGNARSTMIQLNEGQPERLYEQAESMYYVLGGEGTLQVNGRESKLVTNSFAIVPRGTSHAFTRQGRRPLILLAVLSGEPCS